MTGNRFYSSHTYQAIKFSAREKTHCYKIKLDSYIKIALYYSTELNLRNKNQERFARRTSLEGEGQFLNSAPIIQM